MQLASNKSFQRERLHIIDPNDSSNDISGGSSNVGFIFCLFSHARMEILDTLNNRKPASLLAWMLGGNYGVYTAQREHMRKLYMEGKWRGGGLNNE
jgi:non-canonical poly(A) RNA polymerase PAPD5/7